MLKRRTLHAKTPNLNPFTRRDGLCQTHSLYSPLLWLYWPPQLVYSVYRLPCCQSPSLSLRPPAQTHCGGCPCPSTSFFQAPIPVAPTLLWSLHFPWLCNKTADNAALIQRALFSVRLFRTGWQKTSLFKSTLNNSFFPSFTSLEIWGPCKMH